MRDGQEDDDDDDEEEEEEEEESVEREQGTDSSVLSDRFL